MIFVTEISKFICNRLGIQRDSTGSARNQILVLKSQPGDISSWQSLEKNIALGQNVYRWDRTYQGSW